MRQKKVYVSIIDQSIMGLSFRLLSLVLVIFSITGTTSAQKQTLDAYTYFDKAIGIQNTGLYQGVVYTENFRTTNENTQFFKTRQFLPGSVNYEGQDYYDLELKYDVFEDNVLVKLVTSAGGGTLKLFSNRLNGFTIDGHRFIKLLPKDTSNINLYGFYEVSMSGSYFTLFTKYIKKSFERKDRSSVYYEFVRGKSEQILFYEGEYHVINSKRDITALFPNQKKQIDKFYSVARRLRNSDQDAFHIALMKRIEVLLSQTDNQ